MKTKKKSGRRRVGSKAALRAAFNDAGLRLTKQRYAIYRELVGRTDHPDVDTLYRAVKPKIPKMSLFTVYRTMNALENAGMVWRVATWKGYARYDGNVEAHTHFLCETCGRLDDVEGDLERVLAPDASFRGVVNRVAVTMSGECEECVAKREMAREA